MEALLISVALGIVEGVTEFLPVSSTAHIRIAQAMFNLPLDDPFWKMYSIVIQLGAILSVVVYFRRRIAQFVRTFPNGRNGNQTLFTHPLSLAMLAFVVTAIPCYQADKLIADNLESLHVIGGALVIGGAIMWAVDALFIRPRTTEMDQMSLWQAIVVGAAQILSAAFPGTSRSMATIAAGQVAGMSRAAALEFSFFLSIPTMFAATLYSLAGALLKGGVTMDLPADAIDMTPHRWLVLAVGFAVSFFVAWAVVAWFMHWVRRRGFVPFAIYRIVLGVGVLVWITPSSPPGRPAHDPPAVDSQTQASYSLDR
ncbi:MAG TPA: undecaprenyl-diphosphate phosphatase [Tepidisphaeraceae bacterium]|nr:undecaprenyl-diphosphate phosphatase [Tepidisphaeraceae bacterium]